MKNSRIDKGVIYIPETANKETIESYKKAGKTIVIFKSGKQSINNVLIELIKTRLDT